MIYKCANTFIHFFYMKIVTDIIAQCDVSLNKLRSVEGCYLEKRLAFRSEISFNFHIKNNSDLGTKTTRRDKMTTLSNALISYRRGTFSARAHDATNHNTVDVWTMRKVKRCHRTRIINPEIKEKWRKLHAARVTERNKRKSRVKKVVM